MTQYKVEIVLTLITEQPSPAAAKLWAEDQTISAIQYNGEVDPQSLHGVRLLSLEPM